MKDDDCIGSLIETEEGFCIVEVLLHTQKRNLRVFFLLDTGCSQSQILKEIIRRKPSAVSFQFNSRSTIFEHKFEITDCESLPLLRDYTLSGVIGTDFLSANQIIIDFGKNLIFNKSANFSKTTMSFFFPIRHRLNTFIIPIIGVKIENEIHSCLLDSGSNHNVISFDLITNADNILREDLNPLQIQNNCSTLNAHYQTVTINILSLKGNNLNYVPYRIPVAVTETTKFKHIFFRLSILEGLLGYRFLHENHWIIDFRKSAIYSLNE